MGPEGIVYGDKVMNNHNHRRKDVYPDQLPDGTEPVEFVANGEIGMVVGQFMPRARKLKVEFSTQLGVEWVFALKLGPG